MNLSQNPELSIQSQRIAEDFEAFIARGGEVETVPRGAMAEAGWTSRQLVNRAISTKALRESEFAEREARKLAKASLPLPRGSERRPAKVKAPKPAKAPKEPRARAPSPRIYGTASERATRRGLSRGKRPLKSMALLQLLAERGPMRCREIMSELGWEMNPTNQMLWALKNRELLISIGERGSMKFDLAPVRVAP